MNPVLLCDLDGVLVDSTQAIARVYRAWARRHGLDEELVVATAQGRPSRALLMTLVVGGLLTLGAVDWWDRRGPHRATARHERPAPAVAALRSWAGAR